MARKKKKFGQAKKKKTKKERKIKNSEIFVEPKKKKIQNWCDIEDCKNLRLTKIACLKKGKKMALPGLRVDPSCSVLYFYFLFASVQT